MDSFFGLLFVAAIILALAAPVAELIAGLEPVGALDETAFRLIGVAIFAVGCVATIYAQEAMDASWRVGVAHGERTELVTAGPFRWVRNPIFGATLVAAAGLVLSVGNVIALISLALLIAGLKGRVRLVEESHLLRAHGTEYSRYAARVGRFFPGIGKLSAPARDRGGATPPP